MGTRNPATLSAQRKRYRMRHGDAVRSRIQCTVTWDIPFSLDTLREPLSPATRGA